MDGAEDAAAGLAQRRDPPRVGAGLRREGLDSDIGGVTRISEERLGYRRSDSDIGATTRMCGFDSDAARAKRARSPEEGMRARARENSGTGEWTHELRRRIILLLL